MRIERFSAFGTTLLLALAINLAVKAADQQSGTWKMNRQVEVQSRPDAEERHRKDRV